MGLKRRGDGIWSLPMLRTMLNKLVPGLLLAGMVIGLNSCLPLAAGAAAGYIAHDQGYRVQSPLKKTDE